MTVDGVAILARMRLRVYEHFVEHGVPPVVEQLMAEFQLSRAETVSALGGLAERRDVALVKGTARILMAWPFSAVATPFVVRAGGRAYFANCSWDSIAFHALLRQPIRIESHCHHCAAAIAIDMEDGRAARVEPSATIVYLALRPTQWWEDIITTCSNTMVFFCSAEHRDASDLTASPDQAASLTPDQVHLLSIPLYEGRLELDYERPGREALNSLFARLGLTGPYWQI